MKNYLYPQPHGHQANNNGSFDDYDSVVGNEFSASVTTGGGGGSKNSDDMDDLSSLGNSQIGPSLSAANSPVRMNLSAAAAASMNHYQWQQQQQRVSMTPKSNASSSDSDALHVGDVSMILGSVNGDRIAGGGDVESIGGDSLLIMAPPTNPQSSNWERDAAEWNPKPTHRYDNGTSKYLQLGPLGDELSFGGDNPANIKPNLSGRRDVNTYDDYQDDDDEDTRVGFLPTSKLGNCLMIGSTILIIGMLAVAVVAILNMNFSFNQQNGSPRWNVDAAAEGANGTIYTPIMPPTLPPSTLTPATSSSPTVTEEASDATVVPTYVTSPTYSPSEDTYSPTGVLTESPIASINDGSSNSTAAPSKEPTTDEPTPSPSKEPTTDKPTPSPSKEPTTDEPTPSPSKEPTTDEPTPSPSKAPTTVEPTASQTEAMPLNTTSTSAPTTTKPTPSPVAASSISTSSPTKQSLLTTGTQAFEAKDVKFNLVADALWVRQDWRKHFKSLNRGFLIHLGSATPEDDCDEIAYERTATSLSYSPIRAFSLPGNDDYPVSFAFAILICASFDSISHVH